MKASTSQTLDFITPLPISETNPRKNDDAHNIMDITFATDEIMYRATTPAQNFNTRRVEQLSEQLQHQSQQNLNQSDNAARVIFIADVESNNDEKIQAAVLPGGIQANIEWNYYIQNMASSAMFLYQLPLNELCSELANLSTEVTQSLLQLTPELITQIQNIKFLSQPEQTLLLGKIQRHILFIICNVFIPQLENLLAKLKLGGRTSREVKQQEQIQSQIQELLTLGKSQESEQSQFVTDENFIQDDTNNLPCDNIILSNGKIKNVKTTVTEHSSQRQLRELQYLAQVSDQKLQNEIPQLIKRELFLRRLLAWSPVSASEFKCIESNRGKEQLSILEDTVINCAKNQIKKLDEVASKKNKDAAPKVDISLEADKIIEEATNTGQDIRRKEFDWKIVDEVQLATNKNTKAWAVGAQTSILITKYLKK